MADVSTYLPAIDIAGAIASALGFGFTIYVLWIAKDAKRAAESARDAALSAVRKRSLIEDLEDARRMAQQLGSLIQQEQWPAVHMHTEEIVGTCNSAMARWGDTLADTTKDGVLTAGTLFVSIAARSTEFGKRELTPAEKKKLSTTHSTASRLIHTALGEARRLEERKRDDNAD